ncbi:hypothetical protein, partial [Thiolapillus sp.]|uniref:hypothetical protein n=1 Tax=Thiolapillus sp. TaxID=2017437 RepID=UPI003AF9DCC8
GCGSRGARMRHIVAPFNTVYRRESGHSGPKRNDRFVYKRKSPAKNADINGLHVKQSRKQINVNVTTVIYTPRAPRLEVWQQVDQMRHGDCSLFVNNPAKKGLIVNREVHMPRLCLGYASAMPHFNPRSEASPQPTAGTGYE